MQPYMCAHVRLCVCVCATLQKENAKTAAEISEKLNLASTESVARLFTAYCTSVKIEKYNTHELATRKKNGYSNFEETAYTVATIADTLWVCSSTVLCDCSRMSTACGNDVVMHGGAWWSATTVHVATTCVVAQLHPCMCCDCSSVFLCSVCSYK